MSSQAGYAPKSKVMRSPRRLEVQSKSIQWRAVSRLSRKVMSIVSDTSSSRISRNFLGVKSRLILTSERLEVETVGSKVEFSCERS